MINSLLLVCLSIKSLLFVCLSICNLSDYSENPLEVKRDKTTLGLWEELV